MKDDFKVKDFIGSEIKMITCNLKDTLVKAKTLMLLNDFSQLPIVDDEERIQGVVSWRSIAKIEISESKFDNLIEYSEKPAIVSESEDFLKFVKLIAKKDYVLVENEKGKLEGIITSFDMAMEFKDSFIPFLQIGIIEDSLNEFLSLRNMIPENKKDNLYFGSYGNLIDKNWNDLNLKNFDKHIFLDKLDEIRIIRNKIAHYKLNQVTEQDRNSITIFLSLINQILL